MRMRAVFGIMSALICVAQIPAAKADPFIDDRAGVADEYFQNSFSGHNNSLDNLASDMRSSTDYSNLSGSHGHLSNAQSNQTDTWTTSQGLFNNTQMQAVLSGGLNNSNGSNNTTSSSMYSGYGGGGAYGMMGMGGYGSSVSPDSWGSGGAMNGGSYYGNGASSISGGW